MPADLAADLVRHGWDVRRLPDLTRELRLENAPTTEAVADLF